METVRSADGTTIAFDRTGDGPPLVLVNGALSDRSAGASLAAALAPHFSVHGYDRRGRGDSGDTEPYAVDREVEDLDAMIAAAGGDGGDDVFVFGHSSGAALSLEAAAQGLAITRLAVHEPPYMVDDTRPHPGADLADRLRALVASGSRGDAVALFLSEGVGVPPPGIDGMRSSPMWARLEALAHTLAYDVAILDGFALPADRLAKIHVPLLATDGAESPEWVRNTVQAVVEAVPGARHLSLAGQDHGVADDVLTPLLVEHFLG